MGKPIDDVKKLLDDMQKNHVQSHVERATTKRVNSVELSSTELTAKLDELISVMKGKEYVNMNVITNEETSDVNFIACNSCNPNWKNNGYAPRLPYPSNGGASNSGTRSRISHALSHGQPRLTSHHYEEKATTSSAARGHRPSIHRRVVRRPHQGGRHAAAVARSSIHNYKVVGRPQLVPPAGRIWPSRSRRQTPSTLRPALPDTHPPCRREE